MVYIYFQVALVAINVLGDTSDSRVYNTLVSERTTFVAYSCTFTC